MQHSTVKRVGGGAVWALAGRVLGVLAQALMIFLLPRFLSTEQYGAFSLIAPFMLLAAVVGTLGLNDGNVRLLSEALARQDGRRLKYLLRTSLMLTGTLAMFVGVLAAGWLVQNNPKITEYAPGWLLGPIIAVGIVLLSLHLVTGESLRGLHDIRLASLLSGGGTGGPVVTLLFALSVSVVYFCNWVSLSTVMFTYVACLMLVLPFGLYFLWRVARRSLQQLAHVSNAETIASDGTPVTPSEAHSAPKITDIVSVGIPLMFVHLLVFFTMNADVWIVGWFFDLGDVGLYAAARRLMLLVSLPGQVAAQAVMSSIPDLAARGKLQELENLLRRTALLATLPAAALGFILLAIPGLILAICCGSEYAAAASILVVLCIGNLIVTLCGNPIHALIMTGRHYYGLVVYALAAGLLAVVGPWAATHYGVVGVAITTSSCLAFQSIASWLLTRCTLGVWTHLGWSYRGEAGSQPGHHEAIADQPQVTSSATKVPASAS